VDFDQIDIAGRAEGIPVVAIAQVNAGNAGQMSRDVALGFQAGVVCVASLLGVTQELRSQSQNRVS
jgi:hypothetical protein